jgi:putative lipoic acid-binding regulatory protein
VTVTIEARSQQQLDSIYRDLTAHERVKIVL